MNLSTRVSLFYSFILIFYDDQYNDKKIHNIRLMMFSSSLSSNLQVSAIQMAISSCYVLNDCQRIIIVIINVFSTMLQVSCSMFNAHDKIGADQILRKVEFIAIAKHTHTQKNQFSQGLLLLATCSVVK